MRSAAIRILQLPPCKTKSTPVVPTAAKVSSQEPLHSLACPRVHAITSLDGGLTSPSTSIQAACGRKVRSRWAGRPIKDGPAASLVHGRNRGPPWPSSRRGARARVETAVRPMPSDPCGWPTGASAAFLALWRARVVAPVACQADRIGSLDWLCVRDSDPHHGEAAGPRRGPGSCAA